MVGIAREVFLMTTPRPPRLVFLLSVAEKTVRRWIDVRGKASGVTAATAGALLFLAQHPHATMTQLTDALHASPAGASGLLSRMESSGLVSRVADEKDQRVIRLTLTPLGTTTVSDARTALTELNQSLTQGFDQAELAIVARWLTHVADTIDSPRSR